MREISAHLTTMLATREHTRARCVYLALRDGTLIGITDHDKDLTIDMVSSSGSPMLYKANTGVLTSDITLACGLDADNLEIRGPLGDDITKAAVLGKRFNRALVRVFDADWTQDNPDDIPLMQGRIADARIEGGSFVFEVRSDFDRYNQTIGRVLSPYCTADFGDTKCGVARTQIAATVTAVTSDFKFTLNLGGTYADNYFNLGTVEFLTGALAGTDEVEVFDYTGSSGAVTLFVPLAVLPSIGDTLYIRRGCSKLKGTPEEGIPTCLTYDNVLNFRGFDQVPGSDHYLKYSVPGQPVRQTRSFGRIA